MWWLLLLPLSALADEDLKAIDDFDKLMSPAEFKQESDLPQAEKRKYKIPNPKVSAEEIIASGTERGIVRAGRDVFNIKTGEKLVLPREINVHFYRKPDELGFNYLKADKITHKVWNKDIIRIKEELVLYEPPHRYTPAPPIFIKHYDNSRIRFNLEPSFSAGLVTGSYMQRLFDSPVKNGISQQFGIRAFTNWSKKIKFGGAFHFENTNYNIGDQGNVKYQSFSLGPAVKSPDFHWGDVPLRVQGQMRFGPFAKARAEKVGEGRDFSFRSTDFLASLEHPTKNELGAFVVGIFYQKQWLNLYSQPAGTDVSTSGETNDSYGLQVSQVFE